jgi:hypothetical protein
MCNIGRYSGPGRKFDMSAVSPPSLRARAHQTTLHGVDLAYEVKNQSIYNILII